ENAYYPHRFKMQRIFIDKILEGHTFACMKKRKALSLQKSICIGKKNADGKYIKNKAASLLFEEKQWFKELCNNILDAQFFGYSLIQLGSLVNKKKDFNFKNLTILKRWHVSPDRLQYVQIPYSTTGLNFTDRVQKDEDGEYFYDWLIYVSTPSDTGSSICGFGLLYNVALYSIILRNNLSHNADFNQLFASPFRHAKTPYKTSDSEYNNLEKSMANMGNANYIITTKEEEIEFIQSAIGTGFQSYGDLEKRCQETISKIILGHANGLDAQKTALGGGGAGKKITEDDSTPEGKALLMVEKEQDDFLLNALNNTVREKFNLLGIPIPDDECFYMPNDKEEFEVRVKNDEANQKTAEVWKTAKDAGLNLSAEKFTEITGIEAEQIEDAANVLNDEKVPVRLKNKLISLYKHKHGSV